MQSPAKKYAESPVVGLGEILWDILEDGSKNLGGAPANFAYHAGQLGLPALTISAIGTDPLGEETLEELESKKIRSLLQRLPYPTGSVSVRLDDNGIPSYRIRENVAWDNIRYTPEIDKIARSCKAVCFGTLAQRSAVSRNAIRRFLSATPKECMRIFDINLRQEFYSKQIIQESLQQCNLLKINDEELEIVSRLFGYPDSHLEQRCRLLLEEYNLEALILTCGANYSQIFANEKSSFIATPKVEAADTVGAGDAFTGAFCAARLKGLSLTDSHRLAVDTSAYVCTVYGAMPELPKEIRSRFA